MTTSHSPSVLPFSSFLTTVLRGISQIMLQSNVFTGLLFLAGIGYGSWQVALGTLLGSAVGTLTAYVLHYDTEETAQGLYGFSAALVGAAVPVFFQSEPLTWVLVVVGAALAAALQHFFIRRQIPAFTLPFILVTWALLWGVQQAQTGLLAASAAPTQVSALGFLFPLVGLGQVIFQGEWISGLLFLLGLLVSSPLAAVYGLAATLLGGLLASLLGVSTTDIAQGLWGYNAALCAIALAGKRTTDAAWAIGAVLLALLVQLPFSHLSLPALTFPFVAATALCVVLKSRLQSEE